MTSSSRSIFLFEHDLFGKPVPTLSGSCVRRGVTPPAGGRGRRGTAARGCARRAFRRPREGRGRGAPFARALAAFGGLAGTAGSAASMASIAEFGPSSWIASFATSAAMSLMRSRNSAFSMRSVAQELSACCWIALMSRCSLARSSRAMRSCSSTAAFSAAQFFDRRRIAAGSTGSRSPRAIPSPCARRHRWPA